MSIGIRSALAIVGGGISLLLGLVGLAQLLVFAKQPVPERGRSRPILLVIGSVLLVALGGLVLLSVGIIYPLKETFQLRAQLDQLRAAAFQSPLPEVEIAAASALPPEGRGYRGDYHFTQDWFSGNIPVWESVLAPYKDRPSVQYLEVGLYEGRSAVWMLENVLTHPTSHLTGIDVFQGPLKDRCLENLRRSGAGGRVTTIIEPSQVVLRRLPLETFDIIYIDGSHATSDVLEDAVLSYRLLKPGGVLIFDDYRWSGAFYRGPETHDMPSDFPKAAIDRFVQCFQLHLEIVYNSRNGNQLIVRKRSPHSKSP